MKILVFDIGGTALKYGLCADGKLENVKEIPTNAHLGGPHILETLKKITADFPCLDAVGISTAGQVDPVKGSIIYANSNIPHYTGMPLKQEMEQAFGIPVSVENDVNCAAIGEAIYGAGKDFASFLCLTYGTGIGGAIVENKTVYHGSSFSAGEFGGIITHGSARLAGTDCFDGSYERYASTTALVKAAMDFERSLNSGRAIFASFQRPEIKKIVDCWIDEVVLGLITLTHIFNPPCIILGGGIMSQPYVTEETANRLSQRIMSSFNHVKICPALLGNIAGMLGAYHLVSQAVEANKKNLTES